MANLKLVGAVAIKVRPDAKGFRREAQVEIDRELAGLNPKVKIKVEMEVDSAKAKQEAAAAKEEIEKGTLKLKVGIDTESVRAAQRKLDAALKHINDETIVVNFDDEGSIARAQARLDELHRDSKVNIEFTPDERGFREVMARIAEIKRDNIIKETIEFDFDDASLDAQAAAIQARLDALKPRETVTLTYNEDHAGLQRLIRTIDAELSKIREVEFDVQLDEATLMKAKRRALEALDNTPVRIEYDANEAGLRALKARLQAFLPKLSMVIDLDEASLNKEIAKLDARIKEAEQNNLKIKPKISAADYFKTFAAIKTLTKNQTVGIFVKLNNASLLLAAAKLTGLRAATRWTEAFARSLGTLDRNLPIVAAIVVGLSTLASGMLSLTASAFSLGNGLGEVVRMAGLLAPAMLLGLGAVMTVFTGVFKDFGAAVNGDNRAIKKLSESGKKAAAEIRVSFQEIRETISKNFWDAAGDSMLRFTRTALPAVGDGLKGLSISLAGIFSGVLDSFSRLTEQGGVKVFFDNLTRGFDVAQTGMASFMSGFNTLAVVGSTMFPRMGKAFEAWATRFDAWVQRLAADGTLNRWIDNGIQGVKDLFNAAGSLVRVWGNIGQAAAASGALTLHSFSQMLARWDEVTAGDRFQKNLGTIFRGAREATISFHKALGDLGPAMDVFSVTIKHTLASAGGALGAFIRDIGDVMSSTRLDVGMQAFLGGVKEMFEQLRPAMAPVTEILMTFGQILGAVARDSGPLFRNLFQQLATVLTAAWHALEPFLPGLIQIGTTVIDTLGPALEKAATAVIPAFAKALESIGTTLVPLISFFSDVAVNVANFVSGLQVPTVALMAGVILSIGTAFRFAATVVPIATAAMEAYGIMTGIVAIKTQLLVPVIGILLAALTGLTLGGIAALATSQSTAVGTANEYEAALRKDAEAAGALADAVGEATTATAIKNLVDSGAFDAAKKLGIGVQEVTDAVLKGGPALDSLRGRLSGISSSTDESARAAEKAARKQGEWSKGIEGQAPVFAERKRQVDILNGALDQQTGLLDTAKHKIDITAEAEKAAGIGTKKHADAQEDLATQVKKASQNLGAAAAASQVLNDAFSSSTAKVDAMRKSLAILVPPNTKQVVAEGLGAYAKGLNDIRDTAVRLAPEIQKLGEDAFGEDGFLNVASGNKAVLQLNQALVDEVNNVWAGAKTAFDAARAAGDDTTTAFQKAQKFVDDHRGDYNKLATDSGVASEKVQGQWEAVFGKDWVLKVTLEGATEAAATAQALITAVKGNFDGQEFQMFLDANPDQAMKAITDASGVAQAFVDHHWEAKLTALPDEAEAALAKMLVKIDSDWTRNKGFMATLEVAKEIPGLAEALVQIFNGVKNPFTASIVAALNSGSLGLVEAQLQYFANKPRFVTFGVNVDDLQLDQVMARRGAANGAIMDGSGRGMHGFNPKFFANGGIERHVAQITKPGGPIRIWAEPETQGEAYLPYAKSKRPRSVAILSQVARDFGFTISKAQQFANGGTVTQGASSASPGPHTSVSVGTINTVDPETAVRKLRMMQRDALAVAGII